jgi:hypothetical protein
LALELTRAPNLKELTVSVRKAMKKLDAIDLFLMIVLLMAAIAAVIMVLTLPDR